jgi:hypothetical protein
MLGFLFLVSAIIYERDAKMLKYEAERVNWKPRKGVNYYKGLETENED